MDYRNQLKAAEELENLMIASKEVVRLLQIGQDPRTAYALTYELRKRMGYIVRILGAGVPNTWYQKSANEVIDLQILQETEAQKSDTETEVAKSDQDGTAS